MRLCVWLSLLAIVASLPAMSEEVSAGGGQTSPVAAATVPKSAEPHPASAGSQSLATTEGLAAVSAEGYRIAAGDVLAITVWGEEELSRDCQVNGGGTISYPLLGDVACAGLTCREMEATLRDRLSAYLKRPQVLVTVREYGKMGTSIFLLGEVKSPGVYPITSTAGLMQALAAAGGPTDRASGVATIVKYRTGELVNVPLRSPPATTTGQPGGGARLEPGDVVLVNRRADADVPRRYVVLGEVPDPGMFDMPSDREVRVLDAIEKAGLVTSKTTGTPIEAQFPTADLAHALITRGDVAVSVDLLALLQGDTFQNILLQSGDVLTVPRRALVTVYAMGDVRTPGRQMLPERSTLLDLLNVIGGVTGSGRLADATILRVVNGQPTSLPVDIARLLRKGDARQNIMLQDGDVLFVPARGERGPQLWAWLPLVQYLVP